MRPRVPGRAALFAVLLSGVLHTPAAAAAPAAATACTWQASTLPLPSGTTSGRVSATDHQGGYSGTAWGADGRRRVLSWKDGTTTDYGTGGPNDQVVAQNSTGTIIGYSPIAYAPPAGHAWSTRNGKKAPLPKPATVYVSSAYAIKDNGDITGWMWGTFDGVWQTRHVRWPADRPTEFEMMPDLPKDAVVADVDDDGTMLLNFNGNQGTYAVGLWRDGTTTHLAEIPGATRTTVRAISNGRVIGETARPDATGKTATDGVLWDQDGSVHILPGTASVSGINRDGLIGAALDPDKNNDYLTGIWRLQTFDSVLGNADSSVTVVGNDGTIGGYRFNPATARSQPTIWRCGR
ncbi:hypothetical protein PS9374_06748 [Planomonospora sphaerica]|uniref:Uncharacterized protein n=1 Tax=Planomonospora sphaerica TaxID=161355 RepID=A0A161LNL5_9ACTN|nr:hypothetical protein [Planomonospora sphaerica]GAT71057.1 hypothetical protein PS9374_06748 [Planomonospora sphaerica]